jgi:hypothetical protein
VRLESPAGRWQGRCWPPEDFGPRSPPQLRAGDSRWLYLVVIGALLAVLIIGDPGRIDRQARWLRMTTGT